VQFTPNCDTENEQMDQTHPNGQDWEATDVCLMDFSKPNPFEKLLERLGLWPKPDGLRKSFRQD